MRLFDYVLSFLLFASTAVEAFQGPLTLEFHPYQHSSSQTFLTTSAATKTTRTTTSSLYLASKDYNDGNDINIFNFDKDNNSNKDINSPSNLTTRRDAVSKGTSRIVAAVLVTSTTSAVTKLGVSPAFAAASTTTSTADISKQLKQLEKQNADSINSNGAPEKHIPQVTVFPTPTRGGIAKKVQVVVPHVMDAEKPHWIEAIWLKEEGKGNDVAVAKILPATEASPPSLECEAPIGVTLTPFAYCNLHGLWKGETFTV